MGRVDLNSQIKVIQPRGTGRTLPSTGEKANPQRLAYMLPDMKGTDLAEKKTRAIPRGCLKKNESSDQWKLE